MAVGGNARMWLELRGARQVLTGTRQVASGIREVGRETAVTTGQLRAAERRSFLLNQALFTMRRFAYAATLGIGALGGAAVKLGFSFNLLMETNTAAMAQLLGSEQAATKELGYLYDLAARTPFEFQQLTGATRRFLAFGFSLQETNEYMKIIGDTAAGLGGDAAGNIERLVLVLGQVRATGRVLGQDMLQLQQIGINTTKIFREELGLTSEQLKSGVGALQIPAEIAIPAIMRSLNKQFGGMAEQQGRTLAGLFTTLKDYASQLMGTLTMPLFERLRDDLVPDLLAMTQELQQAAAVPGTTFKDLIGIIDDNIGAGGTLVQVWSILANLGRAFGGILSNVVFPALAIVGGFLHVTLLPALQVLTWMLTLGTDNSRIFGYMLGFLLVAFITLKTAMILNAIWTARNTLLWRLAIVAGMRFGGVIRFMTIWTYRNIIALRAWAFAQAMARSSLGTFIGLQLIHNGIMAQSVRWIFLNVAATYAWITATRLFTVAIYGIPLIGWALAAIAVLIVLERKFGFIQRGVEYLWDTFKRFRAWVTGNKISWDDFLPDMPGFRMPFSSPRTNGPFQGMATGGAVTMGGAFLVGERGPEVAMLPRGSAVTPLSASSGGIDMPGFPEYIEVHSEMKIDQKVLGKSVTKYRLDKKARR